MHIEIQVALNFVISYLYNKLPRRRVNIFGEELEKALKHKFQGHWYPEKPFKVSIDFFFFSSLFSLSHSFRSRVCMPFFIPYSRVAAAAAGELWVLFFSYPYPRIYYIFISFFFLHSVWCIYIARKKSTTSIQQ